MTYGVNLHNQVAGLCHNPLTDIDDKVLDLVQEVLELNERRLSLDVDVFREMATSAALKKGKKTKDKNMKARSGNDNRASSNV